MLLLLIISLVSCCLRSINLIVVGSISGDWNRSKFMFVTILYHQVLLQKTATHQGPSARRTKSCLGNFSGFQLTLAMKNSFEICLNYRCVDQIEYTLLQVFQIQFLTFPKWRRFKHCFRVHYNFAAFFRTLILQTGFWRASPFLKFQWIFKNKSQTLFEGFDFWKKAAVATDLAILCNLIRQLFEIWGSLFQKVTLCSLNVALVD